MSEGATPPGEEPTWSRKRKHGEDRGTENMAGDGGDVDERHPEEEIYGADDEKGTYEDDEDEKDVEGDEPKESSHEMLEPSEENFGTIKFYQVCKALEKINSRPVGRPFSLEQKLKNLLPPNGLKILKETNPPQSPFPIIRLLCPEKDASREYFVKHNTLAKAYIKAHAWPNNDPKAQALLKPADPNKIAAAKLPPVQGDLTELIRKILTNRVSNEPSALTVADINKALDELAAFKHRGNMRPSNHDWEAGKEASSTSQRRKNDEKLGALQADWIKRLVNGDRRISPLEHKWLARIILKEMKISMGFDKILFWFDPLAPALWSGHNSLRGLCKIISQPDFHGKVESSDAVQSLAPYLSKSSSQIQLGVPFTPMFSNRTGFDRMLYDLSLKHRTFLKDPVYGKLEDNSSLKMASCMALEHPAFTMETKLDGERMMVHLSRDGIVRIHTRQSNWYSDVYSPVLGPVIRQSFGHHKMDMIIDGEVLAWDNDKEETIPFGNNKTVARLRAEYMKYEGSLDTRDRNLHLEEGDVKVIHMNKIWQDEDGQIPDLNGKDCWLQFIAFDIVFLEGDGAEDVLKSAVSPFLAAAPGSLMDLECIERKKVLYYLIKPVPRFVEVVPTLVVSCDGETYKGESYFSLTDPPTFGGRPLHSLDSVATFLHESVDRGLAGVRAKLEQERRKGLASEDIGRLRALAVGQHYKQIVEDQRQEGLIFKDLSTPYVLDKVSRSLGYWRKFKPDYFNGSVASDIDLIIVGAYFATGLRNSGRPSSYLCACINEQEMEDKYVPCCKVNAGSVGLEKTKMLLDHTGYKTPTDHNPLDTGKWFRYGDSTREFPDFISSISFASDTPSTDGWKPKKEDYPDLWINPEHSRVLTLNAGEIVPSTAFPSRVTLRFPRITQIRSDKKAREVESLQNLWEIHDNLLIDRAGDNSEGAFQSGSASSPDEQALRDRFWSEEKYESAGKGRKKKRPKKLQAIANLREHVTAESGAFRGVKFVPLEGIYRLPANSLEAEEAQEEGWLTEAQKVYDCGDVRALIKRHGGTAMLTPDAKLLEEGALVIGGSKSDPRVVNLVDTIQKAQLKAPELKTKKKPTGADRDSLIFANCKGVVRWTFLLSVLCKWGKLRQGQVDETEIRLTNPDLLVPDSLDFLARPKCPIGNVLDELCRISVQNPTKMRRLLQEVDEEMPREGDDANLSSASQNGWQELCKKSLHPSERWILKCKSQTLWPYEEDRAIIQETIVYVDAFDDPRSTSNNLDSVDPFEHAVLLSVLPLLRLSGGFVENRLGGRVTHILCLLRGDLQNLSFEKTKPDHFADPDRGAWIIEAVRKSPLYPESCPDFVSPSWVRQIVWKHPNSS